MSNILLIYLPFCTPATPPYSITAIQAFLQGNCEDNIEVLDLNLKFHELKFSKYKFFFQNIIDLNNYEEKANEFIKISSKIYSQNNKAVVNNQKPELFDELLNEIKSKDPDVVALSIVYSSQAFYAKAILQELKKLNIKTVIGGPLVNKKLIPLADHYLNNEIEFLELIKKEKTNYEDLNFQTFPNFTIWDLNDYFTPKIVLPLKTTSTCFYKKCTFCTHYANIPYHEYDLDLIKQTIVTSKQKYFFLIDDMISKARLLKFAEMIKPLNCKWSCQLRPTKDLDKEILKILKESGLIMICWGFESGNQRILNLINKGTNVEDIKQVLKDSKEQNISNVLYTMFGFPTETKEEFLDTIHFLEENKENFDLISPTIFGLHENTKIFNNPEKFGIKKIIRHERTVLEPSISYKVKIGLTRKQASRLKYRKRHKLNAINKFPFAMNFFREHMMCLLAKE